MLAAFVTEFGSQFSHLVEYWIIGLEALERHLSGEALSWGPSPLGQCPNLKLLGASRDEVFRAAPCPVRFAVRHVPRVRRVSVPLTTSRVQRM